MPTAARLVAAICFTALGYTVATLAVATLPPNTEVGYFRPFIAALGWLIGWFYVGRKSDRTFNRSLSAGLTGSALLFFWGVFFVAGYQMMAKSASLFYTGPMQALEGMFSIAQERGSVITEPAILMLLVLGGFGGGVVAFIASRFWR